MAAHGNIQIGVDVLSTQRDPDTGLLLAQTGDVGAEEVDADNVEIWQQPGIVSRPAKAVPGKNACQAVIIRETGHDVCVAMRDARGQEIAGSLKEGETCVYASGEDGNGQARLLLKKDSSMAMFTRTSATAKGMGVFLDPASDTIRISNAAGHGIVISPDGISVTISGGSAGVTLGSDGGVKVIGTGPAVVDGSFVALGASATPATPALGGMSGVTGVPSAKVFVSLT